MTPHFAGQAQECEYCDAEIEIGNEAVMTIDGYFCDDVCLSEYLVEGSGATDIYLTDNKTYMPYWED